MDGIISSLAYREAASAGCAGFECEATHGAMAPQRRTCAPPVGVKSPQHRQGKDGGQHKVCAAAQFSSLELSPHSNEAVDRLCSEM